jgi:hypothetical protein
VPTKTLKPPRTSSLNRVQDPMCLRNLSLRLDLFLVQYDIENMYNWIFKERPKNVLVKMKLRSYMNGHARIGEPQFPFSVEIDFV